MTIGIITEYNPFHNGHLYHIECIKEMYPGATIIAVMSSNFTERGDLSILNKWDKTEIALKYGVDLVVELPFTHSSQAADIFCAGSMKLLWELGVNKIVFGSECNDRELLTSIAHVQLDNNLYNSYVKEYLDMGLNYPTSQAKAIDRITGININTPNDILALGYIKEIIKNNYNIEPISIKRTNDYNSTIIEGNITSATSIRECLINNQDIKDYVPIEVYEILNNQQNIFIDDYYNYLKYKIMLEIDNLDCYQTVDDSIIPRIKKYIYESNSLDELIKKVKTKKDTYNKLKRMFVHILVGFTKKEATNNKDIKYIRVLGFTSIGQKHLNSIKKSVNVPIITSYTNDQNNLLNIENRVNRVLGIIKGNEFIQNEYKHKVVIKK